MNTALHNTADRRVAESPVARSSVARSRAPAWRASRIAGAAAVAILGGLLNGTADARVLTWTGAEVATANSPNNWSHSENWDLGRLMYGDELVFAGSTRLSNYNNWLDAWFASLSFAEGAGPFVLGGNSFMMKGDIVNASSQLQTMAGGVIVGATQAWTAGSAGLAFNGISFDTAATGSYTVTASGSISSLGSISNESAYLHKLGTVLSIDAEQSWNMGTKGVLVAALTGEGALNLSGTALLSLGGKPALNSTYAGTFTSSTTGLNYAFGSSGSVQTLTGTGSTLTRLVVDTGTLKLSGASMVLSSTTGSLQVSEGVLLLSNGAKLDASAGNTGGGAKNINATHDTNAVMTLSGAGTEFKSGNYFYVGYDAAGRLNVNSTASFLGSGQLVVGRAAGGAGILNVLGGGTVRVGHLFVGNVTDSAGTATVSGPGSRITAESGLGLGGVSPSANGGVGTLTIADDAWVVTTGTNIWTAGSSITVNGGALHTAFLASPNGVAPTLALTDPANGAALVIAVGDNSRGNFYGPIVGSGSITKSGPDVQGFWSTASTFTGRVDVQGGELVLASGAASHYQAAASSTLRLTYAEMGGATLQSDAGARIFYDQTALTNAVLSGPGAHDLHRVTRLQGVTAASDTQLQLHSGAVLSDFRAEGAFSVDGDNRLSLQDPAQGGFALTLGSSADLTLSSNFGGSGGLSKIGSGALVLSGSNSFTGSVQVRAGVLDMATGAADSYTVLRDAALKLGAANLGFAVVQADFGGSVVYGSHTLVGGSLVGGGTHDVSRVTRYVGTSVSNGVNLELANGAMLSGVNSAGNLHVGAGDGMGWTGGSNAGGLLTLDGVATLANWTSSGLLRVGTAGVLTVANGNLTLLGGSRTYVGSKTEHGGVVQLGPLSNVELNGALLVNNGTINGTTNVNYGSLAKGEGVYGVVNVFDGGVFAAGNSPGTVSTGSVTWNAGGSYLVAMDLAEGSAGIDSGLWNVAGTLDVAAAASGGRFTIRVATLDEADHAIALPDFNAQHNYSWLIASASGGISGYSAGAFSVDSSGFVNALDGGSFSVAHSGNGLYLNFTSAVPEPASSALLAGGAALLWLARRRRARQD